MEYKNRTGEAVDVALPSGLVTVEKNGTLTVKGDDAKSLADHPHFEKVEPKSEKGEK